MTAPRDPAARLGLWAQTACIWEATARKPGNVHRARDFDDLTYVDLLVSAGAIAPVLDRAPNMRVGETVLQGVRVTRRAVATNSNLGILLLLAPLCAGRPDEDLTTALPRVLNGLDLSDSIAVYDAIRLARPGGLGEVPDQDIRHEPTRPLREIMALAQEHDLIARQYVNGFEQVLHEGVPAFRRGLEQHGNLETAIIATHLNLLARHADSLILRKRGPADVHEASARAAAVLSAGWPTSAQGRAALTELDGWLRADGHARNPGTTADLVAASLFAALREGIISLPSPYPWSIST
jgi:triphosphoribosyl-dephospho-CoA synthase